MKARGIYGPRVLEAMTSERVQFTESGRAPALVASFVHDGLPPRLIVIGACEGVEVTHKDHIVPYSIDAGTGHRTAHGYAR